MNKYTSDFINFSVARMQTQAEEIRKWAQTASPDVAKLCCEIIEAAGQGAQK